MKSEAFIFLKASLCGLADAAESPQARLNETAERFHGLQRLV